MRDKKGVSVALLLLAVAGVTLASQREAAEVSMADETREVRRAPAAPA